MISDNPELPIMNQCPFANFTNMVDPDTYAEGMPYEELARIRQSGPIHYMDDPTSRSGLAPRAA